MSSSQEAVRAVALAEAIKYHANEPVSTSVVVNAANDFLTFLLGGDTGPATRAAAGSEPAPQKEGKPSANTAGAKKTTAATKKADTEAAAAKVALERANAEEADDPAVPGAFTADKEGVSAAVAAMIANKSGTGPDRDAAIALLKKYKAASVSAMQAKDEATVTKFINEVNEAFGLEAGEPDLEG